MRIVLRGQRLDLDRSTVERAVRHVEPETSYKHAVEVGGKVYPVKQVLRETLRVLGVTSLSVLDFTSADARSILRRLGFRLFEERLSPSGRRPRSGRIRR